MEKYFSNLPDEDFHQLGEKTEHLVVTADEKDKRAWLSNKKICTLFKQHHITHAGIMWGKHPLEVVRSSQDGSFFMACIKGQGEIIIDGEWQIIKEGQACLLPPLTVNALRCVKGHDWDFCWVRYNELHHRMPISSFLTPVQSAYDHAPILSAIEGLYAECSSDNIPAQLNLWTELIHQYVLKFTKSDNVDERLWKLWKVVENNLGKNWTLSELANLATVSEEHLRRLSNKQLGRSPMQQLTYLRMQKAKILLF